MDDESDQTNRSENSVGTEDPLHKELWEQNERLLSISQSAIRNYENIQGCTFTLKDKLASIVKERDSLKSLNNLLTKRLQEKEKSLVADDFIDKLKSENDNLKLQNEKLKSEKENLKLQNEKLKSENENLKLQNEKLKTENENLKLQNEKLKSEFENVKLKKETSPSKVDKLMVLYRCSEKEKYIASMKLLNAEDNISKLKNELHSLKSFIALQNETIRHENENSEDEMQTSFNVESEATDLACFLSLNQDDDSIKMKPVNVSTKLETSSTQCIMMDKRLLEKAIVRKADKFFDEFEANFEEKRSCLITKLTTCFEQIQVLKKSYLQLGQLKKEKLVLLDILKEMNGIMSNYREQVEQI